MTTYRWQYKPDDDLFLLVHKAVAATVPYPRDLQRWFRKQVVLLLCNMFTTSVPTRQWYGVFYVDVRIQISSNGNIIKYGRKLN